jgi:hypothetical protein
MGWLFAYHDVGKKAFVAELTSKEQFGAALTPIEHRLVGNNLWQLVRIESTGRLTIYLDLIAKQKDAGWGNKGMSEDAGPCEVNCPISLLNRVSPVTEGYAVEWRERVRAHHAEKGAKLKLGVGTVVEYGGEKYRLTYPAGPRKGWNCEHIASGGSYRIKAHQIAKSTTEAPT